MDNIDCRWPVAIGTTESGEERVFDYSKASNILVAGAPKQGKSTAIEAIMNALKSCTETPVMEFRVIDTTRPHWDARENSQYIVPRNNEKGGLAKLRTGHLKIPHNCYGNR